MPLPMQLLAAGIPLTLLLDLAEPSGPDSAGIARAELLRGRGRAGTANHAGARTAWHRSNTLGA